MDISISPSRLAGGIEAVDSKSDAHRLLISAALSKTKTEIRLRNLSKDISATISCLKSLGCEAEYTASGILIIRPFAERTAKQPVLDCGESGSTLRFLLPVAAAVCGGFTITGGGRLPRRPLAPVLEAMSANGCSFSGKCLPITVSGMLHSGKFMLPGDISSQFISGLLFALPLLEGKSEVVLTSQLESSGYVDMTVSTLAKFGISAGIYENRYTVNGGQQYVSPGTVAVEGDWSNAAFWLAAGAVNGSISCSGLRQDTLQSDRRIMELLRQMGAEVEYDNTAVRVKNKFLTAIDVDASEIPDLVPVLAAVCSVSKGTSVIRNIARVRLKESDRLRGMAVNLNAIGADVKEQEDSLVINGKSKLAGGVTDGFNDHRIVMALAAVSAACEKEIVIKGIQAVEKSYPDFFSDFIKLGGKANVI